MVMDVSFRDLLGIHITREGRRSLGLQHARVLPVAFISKVFPEITSELDLLLPWENALPKKTQILPIEPGG